MGGVADAPSVWHAEHSRQPSWRAVLPERLPVVRPDHGQPPSAWRTGCHEARLHVALCAVLLVRSIGRGEPGRRPVKRRSAEDVPNQRGPQAVRAGGAHLAGGQLALDRKLVPRWSHRPFSPALDAEGHANGCSLEMFAVGHHIRLAPLRFLVLQVCQRLGRDARCLLVCEHGGLLVTGCNRGRPPQASWGDHASRSSYSGIASAKGAAA
mmetsp:Transcript_74150/g.206106  ORF Transcript_74150/g.206106 Transcript_74150/m.206106 type:complete len:210 (+) Transcript_74150:596-1225(+)